MRICQHIISFDHRIEIFKKVRNNLELIKTVKNSYITGIIEEKRRIVKIITSNLAVQGKNLMISST